MDKFKFEEIIKAKAFNVVKTERAQFVRRHASLRAKNRMFRAQKFVDKTHRPTIVLVRQTIWSDRMGIAFEKAIVHSPAIQQSTEPPKQCSSKECDA